MAKNKQDISLIIRATDRVTKVMDSIQSKVDRFTLKKARGELVAFGRAARLDVVGRKFGNLTTQAGLFASQLKRQTTKVSLATLAASGSVLALTNSFAKAGDNAAKTAAKLGLPIETLQEWRFAAERADINSQTFDTAIQRLGRRIGEFVSTGSGTAAPALQMLGLSSDVASGKLRTLTDLFPVILDRLGKFKDANIRNAIAMKFFDTEGVKLVNLAKGGSENLAVMAKRARELGFVIEEDVAKSSEGFIDMMADLQAALFGVRNMIGERLMPVIKDLADRFIKFLVRNRENIISWADRAARRLKNLPSFIRKIIQEFRVLKEELRPVINIIERIIQKFGIVKTVFGVLLVVTLGPLVLTLVKLVGAFASLGIAILKPLAALISLSGVMAKLKVFFSGSLVLLSVLKEQFLILAAPVLVLAGKVVLVVSVFVSFFKIGKKLGEFLSDWDPFQSVVNSIFNFLTQLDPLKKAFDFIIDSLQAVDRVIDGGLDKLKNLVDVDFGSVGKGIGDAFAKVKKFAGFGEGESRALTVQKSIVESRQINSQSKVTLDFRNLPRGVRIDSESDRGTELFIDPGLSFP